MAVTVPNTFVAGTPIKSSEVNANFASLDNRTQWVTPEMFGGDIQAALNTQLPVYLSASRYVIDGTQLHLNSNVANMTYIIQGQGKGSILEFKNFTADSTCVTLNDNGFGDPVREFVIHPRLVIQDCSIIDESAVGLTFLESNSASFAIKRVMFAGFKYGVIATKYVDNVEFDDIYWSTSITTGALYKNLWMGDSLRLSRVFASSKRILELAGCHGAVIEACNGGYYEFDRCTAINIIGMHNEFAESGHPSILLKNSSVKIDSSFFRSDNGSDNSQYPAIRIEDVNDPLYPPTSLDLKSVRFATNINDPTPAFCDIYIDSAHTGTTISMSQCRSGLVNVYKRDAGIDLGYYDYRYISMFEAIRIRAATGGIENGINSINNNAICASLQDCMFCYDSPSGAWTMFLMGGNGYPLNVLDTPIIESIVADSDVPSQAQGSTLHFVDGTTYRYRVESYGPTYATRTVASSATTIVHSSASTNSHRLEITGTPGTILRIQRTSGADSSPYEHYIDIPIVSGKVLIWDKGHLIGRHLWIENTTPVSLSGANTSFSGTVYPLTGQSIPHVEDAPSDGTAYVRKDGAWVKFDTYQSLSGVWSSW